MDRRVLRMLREARHMSPREAIAYGLVSAVLLMVAVAAIANQPDLLGLAAAALIFAIGLGGMAVAATAVLRGR
jgi:hypothetical protein